MVIWGKLITGKCMALGVNPPFFLTETYEFVEQFAWFLRNKQFHACFSFSALVGIVLLFCCGKTLTICWEILEYLEVNLESGGTFRMKYASIVIYLVNCLMANELLPFIAFSSFLTDFFFSVANPESRWPYKI